MSQTIADTQVLALAAKNDAALVRWAQTDPESPLVGDDGVSPAVAATTWLRVYPVPLAHGFKPWALGADARARAWRDAEMWRGLVRKGGRELRERVADITSHDLAAEAARMAWHAFADVADEQREIVAYRRRT